MKKPILLLLVTLSICSINAYANTNQQKINIVNQVYKEANQGKDWDSILLKYADNNFKSHINKREFCDADALWGNQDPEVPVKVSVTPASNGKVKATFKQYGETMVNHFSFSCQGNTCKIKSVEYYSCE